MTHKLIQTALLEQLVGALEAALSDDQQYIEKCKSAITAGRAALANSEPKPMRPQMGVDGFWYDREDTP